MTRRKDRREAVFLFRPKCFVNYSLLALTHISENMWWWLLSRLKRTSKLAATTA